MDPFKKRYVIKSAADLLKIDDFQSDIDPNVEPLKRIVQNYYVTPTIQCGLSNCHRWHNEGYLVELESGALTNVGHICGDHFGEKFATERHYYQESILKPQLLQALREGKRKLHLIHESINQLASTAIILSERKSEFRKRFPGISKELIRRASNSHAIVTKSIERSGDEIEDLIASNPHQNRQSLRFQEIEIGRIAGLELFAYNLREKIVQELTDKAHKLVLLDVGIQALSFDTLIRWEGWLKIFDEKLIEANNIVENANKFFNDDNYKLIASLPGLSSESVALKILKTSMLDIPTIAHVAKPIVSDKKLNREERRRLQFGASNGLPFKRSA